MIHQNSPTRRRIDTETYLPEAQLLNELIAHADIDGDLRSRIVADATNLVTKIRRDTKPALMESFLAEYGLSTDEGIALMTLAEALLRVPDAETMDDLIEDKIASSDWGRHLGQSTSTMVNASTWALMLTGKVLDDDDDRTVSHLRGAIKRLGEPVIRTAVGRVMKEMGRQFVLGETITKALKRAKTLEAQGYSYSYDMLGEAAKTAEDATRYFDAYAGAIKTIAKSATKGDIRDNPGISVKLSALHPRYELAQRRRVMNELVPRMLELALMARDAGIGLNIDAEEADRLSISLDVIAAVLADERLADWHGFGVVVQAYGKRASATIDYLYELATALDRRIMVRLVKGAYWDSEIKNAQVQGLPEFPVFTAKTATDISYLCNARKLLGMTDRIYPQFATHNAHTVSAVLAMADDKNAFEFQRLHGMGESLHDIVLRDNGTRCRIYAPVGAHRDLLAYLVRRLLENGANSSFVNQIVDEDIPAEAVAQDPFAHHSAADYLVSGDALFEPARKNSKGFDLRDVPSIELIDAAREPYRNTQWEIGPIIAGTPKPEAPEALENPFDPNDVIGTIRNASTADIENAFETAQTWIANPAARARILNKAADLYEENFGEIFAMLAREAGKMPIDVVAELREAVDFLRYYATQADMSKPVGVYTCISPWNFPLAIFTGQIAAALAAGNAVLAKPAETTPLVAYKAVQLLHEAGVPRAALQLLPGYGATIGNALTGDARVNGVAFTGSTATALRIRANMAMHCAPGTPLIAETGGLNAMIVDSTALPEQAITAIVESAFQSAGQRCSALRCLYVQEDIAPHFIKMLKGTMDEIALGNPWDYATDCGPIIDAKAQSAIGGYVDRADNAGKVLHRVANPDQGHFVAPSLIKVDGIADLEGEVFGPVLHIATFKSGELNNVVEDINATGFGLTFGLQTRIDSRVEDITNTLHAGNIYVNRNQIGAIVGSQPFGGEGLSGTGPKAGGPLYLNRFRKSIPIKVAEEWDRNVDIVALQDAIDTAEAPSAKVTQSLPGPTGESNRLSTFAKGPVLCLGPTAEAAEKQAGMVRALGGVAVTANGAVDADALIALNGFAGVIYWGDDDTARAYEIALSKRDGKIIPLIIGAPDAAHVLAERHVCVDTTAAGGNAALLGQVAV